MIDELPRIRTRRDATGTIHDVISEPCEQCGCPVDHSVDEPGVVWESGPVIHTGCQDPMCECHVAPSTGLRFRLHFGLSRPGRWAVALHGRVSA